MEFLRGQCETRMISIRPHTPRCVRGRKVEPEKCNLRGRGGKFPSAGMGDERLFASTLYRIPQNLNKIKGLELRRPEGGGEKARRD